MDKYIQRPNSPLLSTRVCVCHINASPLVINALVLMLSRSHEHVIVCVCACVCVCVCVFGSLLYVCNRVSALQLVFLLNRHSRCMEQIINITVNIHTGN